MYIDNGIDILTPVAFAILVIYLHYLCYFVGVVVLAFEHVQAVGTQQARVDLHDVFVMGESENGVMVDWAESEVVFGPAFEL